MALIVEREGGVVTASFNRPEVKNAFDLETLEELRSVIADVEANAEDRCLVLTGANGDFCTGADVASLPGNSEGDAAQLAWMRQAPELPRVLRQLRVPTIAKVNGLAVGAGMSIAMGCDIVVASERARFSMIFAKRALTLDFGGSWLLPRLVGLAKAKELALTGDIIDAPTALSIGLIARMVGVDELDGSVHELASALAKGPTLALSRSKQLVDDGLVRSFDESVDAEILSQVASLSTEDAAEAMAAFLEKRQANYQGR